MGLKILVNGKDLSKLMDGKTCEECDSGDFVLNSNTIGDPSLGKSHCELKCEECGHPSQPSAEMYSMRAQ